MQAGRNSKLMYLGNYAPWDHYPKTLTQEEIRNPLIVLTDFFSANRLTGHGIALKNWRDHVVSDEFFNDEKDGPGALLFFYDLNLKLLESTYLLLLEYRENRWRIKEFPEEQLIVEKQTWEYFPDNLTTAQLLYPFLAVEIVFEKINSQMYRDYLHDWVHYALYTEPIDESISPGEVITVYENLLILYSAAWLIHQRKSDNMKSKTEIAKDKEIKDLEQTTGISSINPNPTPAEKLGLNAIRELVLRKLPLVEMIIHLGTRPDPYTFYLLILIKEECRKPEGEVRNKVEDICKSLTNIHAIVHKTSSAKSGISAGNRFWNAAFSKGNILYQAAGLQLPEPVVLSEQVLSERALFHWQRWGSQGKGFLEGAEIYRNKKDYRLTVFMLHQAAESTLKAIIQAILGYRVQMHNLSLLLRLSLLITGELKATLKLDSSSGIQQFFLLQDRYSKSRYSNSSSFDPDKEAAEGLFNTITELYKIAEKTCKEFISSLEKDIV